MPVTTVCPLGNVPGTQMGLNAGLGPHMGLGPHLGMGLGAGPGAHLGIGAGGIGAGAGLAPCPLAGAAKGVTAAMGQNVVAAAPAGVGKVALAGGSIVGGKGLSLGLGIGLGLWGPLVLAGFSAAGVYVLWKTYQGTKPATDEEAEITEALGQR